MKNKLVYINSRGEKKITGFEIINHLDDFFNKLSLVNTIRIKKMNYYLKQKRSHLVYFKYNKKIYKKIFKKVYSKNRVTCILYTIIKNANFFITLTDLKGNVVSTVSTGRVSYSRRKKYKLSPLLVYKMMKLILLKLKEHDIKFIRFHVRCAVNKHVFILTKLLQD